MCDGIGKTLKYKYTNIIVFNHFYCPINALNYTNLEVKIYVV